MLNCVYNWCSKWRLCLNVKKTQVVHFRPYAINRSSVIFTIGENKVSYTPAYKYLGVWFNENLDVNFTAKEIAKSAHRALGVIICKFKACGGMAYDVFNKLYENLVQPSLSYGAAV